MLRQYVVKVYAAMHKIWACRTPVAMMKRSIAGRISAHMLSSISRGLALGVVLLLAAGALYPGTDAQAAQQSSCVPRGDAETTYLWDRLNIVRRADGSEMPTATSLASLKANQTGQIALDPVRNVQVAFISGVTLEAPAGSEDWTVVETPTCPPARWAGAMAYDPVNNEIVLWGGTLSIDGPTDDMWLYDTTHRDWRKLADDSPQLRDLRASVADLRDELETLRWDSWKTLEWKTTGKKQGAATEAALGEQLGRIKTDLDSAEALAAQAESALAGYEKSQAAGARTWLAAGRAKLARIGSGIEAGTLAGLESDYRALVALRTDVLSAVDSVRFAPPSNYFVSLTYDAAQQALVLGSALGGDYGEQWVYRLAEKRWERKSPPPGSAVSVAEPTGDYVLRDEATVAELEQWQAETSAWAVKLPPNTWVPAPSHGTGRPNEGRSWSSIVYDPDREQLYYRDGGHGSYHGNVTDHYDVRTGRWFRSDVAQVPDGRIMGSYFGWGRGYNYAPWAIHTYKWQLFYNPLTKHLQRTVFFTPNRPLGGNVHDYDPDQGKWSKQPATVNVVGQVVPGVTDGIVSVYGWDRYSGIGSATVGYETASEFKKWTSAGPIAFPGNSGDDGHAFFFDPKRKRVMYYGGEPDTLGVFALDLEAARPRWARLDAAVAGGGAFPLAHREWIYVPKHDMFLTLERQPDGSTAAPKLWSFDPRTNLFRRVELALGPGVAAGPGPGNLRSASVSCGLAYDPVSDVAFYIHASLSPPVMFAFRYVPVGG
jgi:hypothetical protein